jgi:hypothetical protein
MKKLVVVTYLVPPTDVELFFLSVDESEIPRFKKFHGVIRGSYEDDIPDTEWDYFTDKITLNKVYSSFDNVPPPTISINGEEVLFIVTGETNEDPGHE